LPHATIGSDIFEKGCGITANVAGDERTGTEKEREDIEKQTDGKTRKI
jgi:hypothetical protein